MRSFSALGCALLVLFISVGCQSSDKHRDHPKQNEKPDRDNSPIDHDQIDDSFELFSRLDESMRRWRESHRAGNHGWTQALERELRELVLANFSTLVETLQTGDGTSRVVCAMALGFSRDSRALSPLLVALKDPDSFVQSNTLLSIGLIHDPDTPVEPVLRLLESPDGEVRSSAAYCLGQVVPPRSDGGALVPLLKILRNEAETNVKNHAVISLGNLGNHMSVKTLISTTLFAEHPSLRLNSAVALGKIKDRRSVIPLVRLLDDPERSVRLAAEESLAEITGEQFASNRKAWEAWIERNRDSLE